MKVTQVYSLMNDIAQQAWGEDAIAVQDLTGLISLGNKTLSSSTDIDNFLKVLVDRIGRTVIRNLDLEINYPNIVRDGFEFGAVLQKISVQPLGAEAATQWDVGSAGYTPDQFRIRKANVVQSLFSDVNTWMFMVTVPDVQFKSAFTSAEAMGAFIEAIINSLTESMTMSLNNANITCVNNFIGEKIHAGNNLVHLLTEYNAIAPTPITAANAIYDKGFLRFMGKRISDYIRYLNEPSVRFNEDNLVRRTARDNMHVFLIDEVASAFSTYLESDTFNYQLLDRLPLYQPVTAWQSAFADDGQGAPEAMPDFATATTINIKTTSGDAVNQNYVVCCLADREALGTTIYDLNTATDRNNMDRYTNYSESATIGYFNDLSENGIVFVID